MTPPILAHVIYVTEARDSPDPLGFLLTTLSEPVALLLILGGFAAALAAFGLWLRWRPALAWWDRLVERAWTYRELVPWMLRLSFGLVLIGAGLSGAVFAPQVGIGGWPHILQTALGFLLLLGFAVRLAALVGLAAYAVALVLDPTLVIIFDVAGGLAAVALLGPGRPSLDDLLKAAFPRGPGGELATRLPAAQRFEDVVPLLIRIGLGGALLASGIVDKLLVYEQGLATVERYNLTAVVPVSPELWVVGAALVESALGLAILVGVGTRVAAMTAFFVLTLTLFALPDDPAIAHVGLFGLASILVVLGAGRWSIDARLPAPRRQPEAVRAA
ncbi:MAG TPA: DoxX family protein [Candidatus Limnocylindrales bacterium]|nr:DoxX family protein [Candidatus Limnocylindrales bacterium]